MSRSFCATFVISLLACLMHHSHAVNKRSILNQRLLEVSASSNAHEVKTLLCRGARVNTCAKSKDKLAPLHRAAIWNRVPVAKALLEKSKVQIDIRDARGFTPLMYATMLGHEEMIVLLIDAGANVNAQNERGQTALHLLLLRYTLKNQDYNFDEALIKRIIKMFVDAGFKSDSRDKFRVSVFGIASPEIKSFIWVYEFDKEIFLDRIDKTFCAICHVDYHGYETFGILDCHHAFHLECIKSWFKINKYSCPMCRQKSLYDEKSFWLFTPKGRQEA